MIQCCWYYSRKARICQEAARIFLRNIIEKKENKGHAKGEERQTDGNTAGRGERGDALFCKKARKKLCIGGGDGCLRQTVCALRNDVGSAE
jgi:hypothetical protein